MAIQSRPPVFLAEHWEAISHILSLVFRTEHCGKLVLEQAMARSISTGDSSLIPLSHGFVRTWSLMLYAQAGKLGLVFHLFTLLVRPECLGTIRPVADE